MNTVNDVYTRLINNTLSNGNIVDNTIESSAVCVELTDVSQNILRMREGFSFEYLFGELVWYFSGDNSTEFIRHFGSMWERISDDGLTNNSAYGYVLMKKFGFNQIEKIIELLKKDPTSRRAILNINSANEQVIETKDEPCTLSLQFLLRDGRLHLIGVMRSNDLWFGFPYDIAFFTELQKYIARRLGVAPGKYTHFVGSLHIYQRNLTEIVSSLDHKDESCKNPFNMEYLIKHASQIRDDILYMRDVKQNLWGMIRQKHPEVLLDKSFI